MLASAKTANYSQKQSDSKSEKMRYEAGSYSNKCSKEGFYRTSAPSGNRIHYPAHAMTQSAIQKVGLGPDGSGRRGRRAAAGVVLNGNSLKSGVTSKNGKVHQPQTAAWNNSNLRRSRLRRSPVVLCAEQELPAGDPMMRTV